MDKYVENNQIPPATDNSDSQVTVNEIDGVEDLADSSAIENASSDLNVLDNSTEEVAPESQETAVDLSGKLATTWANTKAQ